MFCTEKEIVTSTLTVLRAIRVSSRDKIYNGNPSSLQSQKLLEDSKRLATACSSYLIGSIREEKAGKQYKVWLDDFNSLSAIYRADSVEVDGPDQTSLEKAVKRVYNDWRGFELVSEDPLHPSNIEFIRKIILDLNEATFSVQSLFNNKFLLFSPLSTDYLRACLLHEFVQSSSPNCFKLQPLILDQDLRLRAIPNCGDGKLTAVDSNQTDVFVELSISHKTMQATLNAVYSLG